MKYATASMAGFGLTCTSTLDVDRHRAERGEAGQGRVEAALGQDRRVHAADQVPQFGQRRLRLDVRPVDQVPGRLGVVAELRLGPAEFHRQRDQPLLGAVVQVALDPLPLGLGRVHHPLAAHLQLGDPGGQVRRGREQPPGQGGVGGREAAGHPRRPGQQQRGADGRCRPRHCPARRRGVGRRGYAASAS